ncbi:hypothetical protein ACS0TY_032666 [Phlomoides rotata]
MSSICVASPFEVLLLCRSSHVAVCRRLCQNDQDIFGGEILENERDRASENGTIDGQGGLWHAKKPAIPSPHNKPEQLVLNIDDFGAKAGGISDNSQAFEKAWDKGCNSMESAKIMVPKGRLIMLSMSILQVLAISLFLWSIRGTIKSFPQMYDFPKRLWIKFEDVTNIDVFGGGTIDGNGQVWWNNSCKIKKTKVYINVI